MKTLILGGVKSGKSRYAEQIACTTALPITVIATAMPDDAEMSARIERHKADRPANWTLIEEPIALGAAIESNCVAQRCVVVDCLTLWLTQLLLTANETLIAAEIKALRNAIKHVNEELIIVSNETSMGIVPLGELSRRYCDEAGLLHQYIAEQCDRAMLVVAGLPIMLKGKIPAVNA